MSGWPIVALRDVAEIERDIIEASAIENGTLYVGLENIQRGGDFIGVRPVDTGELASSKFAFSPKHLLYGKLRPYLAKIARPQFSGICSTDILPVLPGPKLDRNYLAHFLLTPNMVALASSRTTGANLPRLSPRALEDLKVPLPPLPEQRRIAEVLDRAEALRVKRRAALAQLDTLTQAIFIDMFGDPATNPKGWPTKPLGDVMSEVYRYPTYYDITYEEDGVPEIRGELLQEDGSIVTDRSRLRYISPQTSARFPRTVLAEGDLVMSVRGTIGKIGLVPSTLAGANMTANLIRMAPDRALLDPTFAWHFTQTHWFKGQLANACSSTTILTIKAPDLKRLAIPLPPLALQQLFVRRISAVGKLKATYCNSMTELDALFASLQHRAFRGEL